MKVELDLQLPTLLVAVVAVALTAWASVRLRSRSDQPRPVTEPELSESEVPVLAPYYLMHFRTCFLQTHLAIILDGNRRFARRTDITYEDSYRKGAEVFKQSIEWCLDLHIRYYTVFAFSTENWRREESQVHTLLGLFEEYLLDLSRRDRDDFEDKRSVAIRFIGRRDRFTSEASRMMADIERRSCSPTMEAALHVYVAVDYGGQWDIAQMKDKNSIEAIIESFPQALSTSGAPPVDLLIRTGGNSRISNFLLWQIAYSHIVVVNDFWPEMTFPRLKELLLCFSQEPRNFGK